MAANHSWLIGIEVLITLTVPGTLEYWDSGDAGNASCLVKVNHRWDSYLSVLVICKNKNQLHAGYVCDRNMTFVTFYASGACLL